MLKCVKITNSFTYFFSNSYFNFHANLQERNKRNKAEKSLVGNVHKLWRVGLIFIKNPHKIDSFWITKKRGGVKKDFKKPSLHNLWISPQEISILIVRNFFVFFTFLLEIFSFLLHFFFFLFFMLENFFMIKYEFLFIKNYFSEMKCDNKRLIIIVLKCDNEDFVVLICEIILWGGWGWDGNLIFNIMLIRVKNLFFWKM